MQAKVVQTLLELQQQEIALSQETTLCLLTKISYQEN
jgi:hypothetical protein